MQTKEEVLQQIYFNNCFEQLSKAMQSLIKANPTNRKLKELASKLREMFFHFNSVHLNNKLLKSELNTIKMERDKLLIKIQEHEQGKT
tara:strand:- start:525 stop:788 length:264 start_codon:yes stop_codon:yes gene_type:complete